MLVIIVQFVSRMHVSLGSSSGLPRPEGVVLQVEELRPADVLLSRGTGLIPDCIVATDGGSYSHAALWTGESVLEAAQDGISEGASPADRDVYRFTSEVQALSACVAERLVANARAFVGGEYALSELFLLGVLFGLGFAPRRSFVHRALDALGGVRAERLEAWLAGLTPGCVPMLCTELVSGAYYSVCADHRFALRILPRGALAGVNRERERFQMASLHDGVETTLPEELGERCYALVHAAMRRRHIEEPELSERKLWWGTLAVEAGTEHRLGVVTPGDLQFSPNLRFCGRVAGP